MAPRSEQKSLKWIMGQPSEFFRAGELALYICLCGPATLTACFQLSEYRRIIDSRKTTVCFQGLLPSFVEVYKKKILSPIMDVGEQISG